LNPGLGFHTKSCGCEGQVKEERARPACKAGSRCTKKQDAAHLAEEAHPLDQDYAAACAASKVDPEPLSIKVIFDWADADGSGKLERKELEASFSILKGICKDYLPDITEKAWNDLDEDGNGVLNFMEFASWAGPRLGLPLGMKRMIARSASAGSQAKVAASPCTVIGCPCEHFDGRELGRGSPSMPCKSCKHKCELHKVRDQEHAEVPYPDYWTNHQGLEFSNIVDLNAAASGEFQAVIDMTYVNKWTRDRSRHNPARPQVPKGFKVVAARRNENAPTWIEYGCRRAEVLTRLQEADREHNIELYSDVMSMLAYKEVAGQKADRLAHEANEWYLFHGTSPENARKIMKDDFRVSLAGANTGTLYGRGLYFAESITKADEYAKPDANGNYAVLLCRVVGGIVKYTDEVEPDPEELVQSCITGRFNCVLGDRKKCRGTFREFVLFDSEDVYPEYLIEYTRDY